MGDGFGKMGEGDYYCNHFFYRTIVDEKEKATYLLVLDQMIRKGADVNAETYIGTEIFLIKSKYWFLFLTQNFQKKKKKKKKIPFQVKLLCIKLR